MGPIEKEFDPSKHTAEYVAVERDDSMAAILEKVSDALKRTPYVIMIVPRGAHAFHSTQDFLALGKLQWAEEVRVALASPDPVIAGLGRVLGFHIVDPPADHPALAGDPALDNDPPPERDDAEKPTAPLPLGALPGATGSTPDWVLRPAVPTYPSASLTTSTWLNMPAEGMGSRMQRVNTPGRSGMPPPRTKPRQTGVLLPTMVPPEGALPQDAAVVVPPGETGEHAADGPPRARRAVVEGQAYAQPRGMTYNGQITSATWRRVFAVLGVLLVLAMAAGSAYAYVYLPEGTVSVTPSSRNYTALPVEVAVTTGDAAQAAPESQGDGLTLHAKPIPGVPLQAPLSEQAVRPASGTRQVPRGKATGAIHFVNTTSAPRTVPAGAQFEAPNGVTVQTTQGGTVPATIFGQSFGEIDLPVEATVEGPEGNIAAGQIRGVYGGALQYNNTALQGGTIETLKVVTQEDIDAVVADLSARVEGQVAGAIVGAVPQGHVLITQTVALTDRKVVADRKAGEDGEAVSVQVSAVARAVAYKETAMHDAVAQAVIDWLGDNTENSPIVQSVPDVGSVQYGPPVVAVYDPEAGRLIYRTEASARVRFTFTPELTRQIREMVKGKDVDQARAAVMQTYGGYLNMKNVSARLLWFNIDKLPSDPARIVVEIGGDPNAGKTPAPAAAAPKPDARETSP
jgi:hypothetical protein